MKTKNVKIILGALMLLGFTYANSQEFKVNVAGKNVSLIINEVNKVEITGNTGTEIIFSTTNNRKDDDERSKGLTAIGSLGLEDNSGIGLSIVESDNSVKVDQISRNNDSRYVIQVPKNVKVVYEHNGVHGSKVKIRDLGNELELSTNHSGIRLENVSGPLTINTVHGDIEASFTTLNQTAPSSIVSVHGHIDISLPSATKADIRMDTNWGEIFTDMDIDFDKSGDMRKVSSQSIRGKLNSGGVSLHLSSTHDNIYLRKK